MILITDWFDGISKIIVAIGSLGGVIAAVAAWREARNSRVAAEKNTALGVAHTKTLDEQTGTLARVEGNTDGGLEKITAVAKKLGIEKDALAVEVERLQPTTTDPTPTGPPTAENPVTMVGTRAKTYVPPPGTEPRPDRGDLNTDESGP